MKVKEIELTANVAWSPDAVSPVYLATGTAAQQLDDTFSTTSALEIHELRLSETGRDAKGSHHPSRPPLPQTRLGTGIEVSQPTLKAR